MSSTIALSQETRGRWALGAKQRRAINRFKQSPLSLVGLLIVFPQLALFLPQMASG